MRVSVALLIAVAVLAGLNAWQWQRNRADAAVCARDKARAEAAATAAELAAADAAGALSKARRDAAQAAADAYSKGKDDAERAGSNVVADLRTGALKLRDEWRGCQARLDGALSGAAAAAGRADAAEQRRQDSAGRIVRAAEQCDAQVTALQAFLRAEWVEN